MADYKFGQESEGNLQGVHAELVRLARMAIQIMDCKVTDGIRTQAEQVKNVDKGVSQTMNSMHLPQDPDGLAHAIDIMPYPIKWDAIQKGFDAAKAADPELKVLQAYFFQGIIKGIAFGMGIPIRQGIDWNGDNNLANQSFFDIPHVELKKQDG